MGDSGSNMDAPGRGTGENGIEKCYLKLDNSMRSIGLNEEEISQIAPQKAIQMENTHLKVYYSQESTVKCLHYCDTGTLYTSIYTKGDIAMSR